LEGISEWAFCAGNQTLFQVSQAPNIENSPAALRILKGGDAAIWETKYQLLFLGHHLL
jgi:hypothetical protein